MPMTCKELIDFLWRYEEDELPEHERSVFRAHLEVCPDCVRYLETYRETVRLAKEAVDPAEAPEELVHAILAARSR
jgi:anti-sigma factor RsiW